MNAGDAPLASLQRAVQHYLLSGDGSALAGRVRDAAEECAAERLAIYRDAYALRLIEALQADFTTVHAALGDDAFASMARSYVRAQPSRHPSIRWFGAALATHLRDTPPWAEQDLLAELAAFDWAISLALDAADAEVLAEAELLAVAPERWPHLCFTLHPSVTTLDLYWNVGALRRAVDAGDDAPTPQRGDLPARWLVWRQGLQAHYRSMTVDEAFSLQAAAEGANFAELCAGLCEWLDAEHVAVHAAGTLRRWVADGVLSTVHNAE